MEIATLETRKADLEGKVKELSERMKEFKIENDDDLQAADRALLLVQERTQEVEALMDPICESAHETHKRATTARGLLLNPLLTLKTYITRTRGAYMIAQEAERKRLAKIAQDKADADAKAVAKAHADEVERLRLKDESDRLDRAAKLEAEGKTELAEHVLTMPAAPPPPPPPRPIYAAPIAYAQPTKTAGVSSRDNWKAAIETDPITARAQLLALVKAAALDPDRLLHFLNLNASALNAHAKQTKGAVAVPGITFFNDVTTSVRAGRG